MKSWSRNASVGCDVDYQALVESIVHDVTQRWTTSLSARPAGEVASYIPELANVVPTKFGLALRDVDGQVFAAGDADERFSIQSISKVLALAFSLTIDREEVWRRVGVEPSGDPFNSLVQLEYEQGRPRNPLINAGALVVSDIVVERLEQPKLRFLDFVRLVSGIDSVEYDLDVATSELRTTFRNRSLLNLMKDFGNIRCSEDAVIDFYVHMCSLAMSCRQLTQAFSFLADHGRCLPAGRIMLARAQVKRINALLLTCGFYDEAGEFAFRVGLPGKSGVGGGIVAVCPERFSVATWSPPLGSKGNSIAGTQALAELSRRTDSSIF